MKDPGYKERTVCSLCAGTNLDKVFGLGWTPIANEYAKSESGEQDTFPLEVVMCQKCRHSQIGAIIDPTRLFGEYDYTTATSPVTVEHVSNEAEWIKRWYRANTGLMLDEKSVVVEVGSNDGTMLKALKKLGVGCIVGVDPSASRLTSAGVMDDVHLVDELFTAVSGTRLRHKFGAADVVVANNVLAHVPNVRLVVLGVKDLLTDRGVFVFEVSYLMDMAEEPLFDTIYHEHMSYHALKPLALMLDDLGMPIKEVMRLPGQKGRGSLRVACVKGKGRSIDSPSVRNLMIEEAKLGLWDRASWRRTYESVLKTRDALRSWIETLRAFGEPVMGYGAPAKLTTLMYALGLDRRHVDFIVDDAPLKQGLYTPGTKIPIRHPSALKEVNGGTVIVFAWNFYWSIISKNLDFKGRFLVPLPELKEFGPEKWARGQQTGASYMEMTRGIR